MRTDMIQHRVLVVGVCVRPRTFIISRQLAMEYITLLRRDLHSWIEAETRSRERETDWANGTELKIAVFASFFRLQTINYLSAGGNYSAGGKDTVTITFIFPLWLTVDPHQRADLISDLCVCAWTDFSVCVSTDGVWSQLKKENDTPSRLPQKQAMIITGTSLNGIQSQIWIVNQLNIYERIVLIFLYK